MKLIKLAAIRLFSCVGYLISEFPKTAILSTVVSLLLGFLWFMVTLGIDLSCSSHQDYWWGIWPLRWSYQFSYDNVQFLEHSLWAGFLTSICLLGRGVIAILGSLFVIDPILFVSLIFIVWFFDNVFGGPEQANDSLKSAKQGEMLKV